MQKTVFLTVEQVIVVHDDQIERYGGSHGIARLALLESATIRPQANFGGKDLYTPIFDKAGALMHSLIMNHAFVDGNKRTASISGILFLEYNDYLLEVKQDELVKAVLKVSNNEWGIKDLSSWLEKHSNKARTS